ncbi:MAG: hypothetical protein ACR2QV_08885 [Gammaproteobacteria bacterium]
MKRKKIAALLLSVLVLPLAAHAESEHGDHEYHPNLFAVFAGVTSEDRRENGLTLGIEYERRLNKSFGIGALAERTFGDIDAWVFVVPFAYHRGPWKFMAGLGLEDADGHSNEALVRIGIEYGFEVGKWDIGPQLDVDFVDSEEVFIVGVTFGRGF